MIRLVIIFFILLLNCNNKISISGNRHSIVCWEGSQSLTWKDFKGKFPKNTRNSAETHISFHYEILSENTIIVQNCLDKNKSWVKKEKASPHLLRHEQYHFNLSEVYARRIRQEMGSLETITISNTSEIYERWMKKHWIEQALYDEETNHSIIIHKQELWQNRIDEELQDLEAFAEKIVFINQ